METFLAYKSRTGKRFETPSACLLDEVKQLRQELICAIQAAILLPYVDWGKQCAYIREKLQKLEAKGYEYHAALQGKKLDFTSVMTDIDSANVKNIVNI